MAETITCAGCGKKQGTKDCCERMWCARCYEDHFAGAHGGL